MGKSQLEDQKASEPDAEKNSGTDKRSRLPETQDRSEADSIHLRLMDDSYSKDQQGSFTQKTDSSSFRFNDATRTSTLAMGNQLEIPSLWGAITAPQNHKNPLLDLNRESKAKLQGVHADKDQDNKEPALEAAKTGEHAAAAEKAAKDAKETKEAQAAGDKSGLPELTKEQKEDIARRIFYNETSGNQNKLCHWNPNESFLSCGFNHMTWQPKGSSSIHGDSFLPFIKRMEKENPEKLPSWLNSNTANPWSTKARFESDHGSKKQELKAFLIDTIPEQIDHSLERLNKAIPRILDSTEQANREKVQDRYNRVMNSGPNGVAALVDYVNFKGEGLKLSPSYNNNSWGLRQVLENMKDLPDPVKDFSESAQRVLQNRVENAPAASRTTEQRWLQGWTKRVSDYQKSAEELKLPELPRAASPESNAAQKEPKATDKSGIEAAVDRMKQPEKFSKMNAKEEKQWLESSSKAASEVGLQRYRAQYNCGAGSQAQLKRMGYEIEAGQSPQTASQGKNVWTGVRVMETLAAQPGFTRVPISMIEGGMKSLPDGTPIGRYHTESAMKNARGGKGYTMHNRFGEDPGDSDTKYRGHVPKADGSFYRDSFAVLPNGIADSLIGKKHAEQLRSQQALLLNRKGDNSPTPALAPEQLTPRKAEDKPAAPEQAAPEKNDNKPAAPGQAAPEKNDNKPAAPEQAAPEKNDKGSKPESEREKVKPDSDAPDKTQGFELPNAVYNLSKVKRGQGYYQPIKSAMKELLGRAPSEGEIRATISAARAMRKGEDQSVKELKVGDALLPGSKEQAETFLKNLGNSELGKQYLSQNQIDNFRNDLKNKFAMNEPQPEQAKPQPEQAKPQPEQAKPQPEQAKPQPEQAKPQPEQAKPQPEQATPQPEQAKPQPEQAKPQPEQATPQPEQATPSPEQPTPQPEQATPQPEQAKPQPEQVSSRLPLEDEDHARAEEGDPFTPPKAKTPEEQRQNQFQILRMAKGSTADGVSYADNKKALVRSELTLPKGVSSDLPVAVVPGTKPGSIGILKIVDEKGEERQVPFVSGLMSNGKGTRNDIVINNAAAQELGLKQAKPGERPGYAGTLQALIFANEKTAPKDAAELKQKAFDALHLVSGKQDVRERAIEAGRPKEVKGNAYIPKPDDNFGYRRTERSDKDLSSIQERLQKEAKDSFETAERLKPGSPESKATIDKILQKAQTEKSELEKERSQFQTISDKLKAGLPSSQLPNGILQNLPPDLARDLRLARYNRMAYEKNMQAVNDPMQFFNREINMNNARQAVSYYHAQEARAREKAAGYAQLSADKIVLQDRIIKDATNPTEAQALLRHRFAMKAAAAHAMSANPDLISSKAAKGALEGKRIVVNAGHDIHHGSKYTGFPAYAWSKTKDNPNGMSEYDFNKESTAILAEMIQFAGGVPIHVNQDELYATNKSAQYMPGLAAAMLAPKADAIISNHGDSFKQITPGTLTLVSSKSHKYGVLVNQAKSEIASSISKGVRQQSNGVQEYIGSSNVILNEILSTAPADRAKFLNPHELAKLQLGTLVGTARFLNPPSESAIRKEQAADKNSSGWKSYWEKPKNTPQFKIESLPYPKIY